MTVSYINLMKAQQKVTPDRRWTSLSFEDRVLVVKEAAARGLTEREINAETGAANGAVRGICQRHSIRLTSHRDKKAREAVPDEGEAYDHHALRLKAARHAAAGAKRTRLELARSS